MVEQGLRVPPLDEQRRIVEILEDHLSRLESGVGALRRNQMRLAALRDRAVRSLLVGEPNALSARHIDPADCDDGRLPDLAEGWQWRRLSELAEVVGGVTKDAKKQADPRLPEWPYLRVANVQRGRLDLDKVAIIRVPEAKARTLVLRSGDVLLNEGGDRDKLGRGWVWEGQIDDCIHQNHVFRARVLNAVLDPYLLSWAANTFGGPWCERNGKQSVNLASISLTKIKMMPIPTPPLEEQARMVAQLREQLTAADQLQGALDAALARSDGLRRSLLAAAFSGRLTGGSSDLERGEEAAAAQS